MNLPMTEQQAEAAARPGERSSGFTCADCEALLEVLGDTLADGTLTRLHVEKTADGFFGVLYRMS